MLQLLPFLEQRACCGSTTPPRSTPPRRAVVLGGVDLGGCCRTAGHGALFKERKELKHPACMIALREYLDWSRGIDNTWGGAGSTWSVSEILCSVMPSCIRLLMHWTCRPPSSAPPGWRVQQSGRRLASRSRPGARSSEAWAFSRRGEARMDFPFISSMVLISIIISVDMSGRGWLASGRLSPEKSESLMKLTEPSPNAKVYRNAEKPPEPATGCPGRG